MELNGTELSAIITLLHGMRFYYHFSPATHVGVLRGSVVSDSVTPWTVAYQAPLYVEFSRQEYWSGLPCPPPQDLPNPVMKPTSLMSPALAGWLFTTSTTWGAPPDNTHTHTHTQSVIFPTEAGSPAVLRQKYLTFKTKSFRRPRSEPRKVCWASLAPGWPWLCAHWWAAPACHLALHPSYSIQQTVRLQQAASKISSSS